MDNNYKIRFKLGVSYQGEFDLLFRDLFTGFEQPIPALANYQKDLKRFNRNTRRQLQKFVANENYSVRTLDSEEDQEVIELLLDMVPSLCLRRSDMLLDELNLLKFGTDVQQYFIDKKKLDLAINSLCRRFNLNESVKLTLIGCCYSIAVVKCRLKVQEALGQVYTKNGRYITNTKYVGEKLLRKLRDGSKIRVLNGSSFQERLLNSSMGHYFIATSSKIASKAQDDAYNVQHLAGLIYIVLRLYIPKDISDRKIILSLYEIFKILYSEKGLHQCEQEWIDADQVSSPIESPIGDNYLEYKVRKVKSIIGYNTADQIMATSKNYEAKDETFNADDFWRLISMV